jgi:formylglycine-generating enzyme required for sulfatase activity
MTTSNQEGPVQRKIWYSGFFFAGVILFSFLAGLVFSILFDDDKLSERLAERKSGSAKKVIRQKIVLPSEPIPGEKMSNSLGMAFVYIPAGRFTMGSPEDEPGRKKDEKQFEVTLTKGFYMQTTEVTQGQWQAVMGNNPSFCRECGNDSPVESVSWNDVQSFVDKLNHLEEKKIYRLPTEAEWEIACRAGKSTSFHSGNITELTCGYDVNLDAVGWCCGNSSGKPHPVAQKAPNLWGLYDMHGNVYEWCQDWAGQYPSGHAVDPTGPRDGSYRILRGGSWESPAKNCRSAVRGLYSPDRRDDRLGFRIVRNFLN